MGAILVIAAPAPAVAQAGAGQQDTCPHEAFRITGVEVASEASDATIARRIATEQGESKAWAQLKSRLLLSGQKLNDGETAIAPLIDHRRVASETVLARRYSAVFDYCFDRDKVRALFKAKGVRHAELISTPIVVVPIWNGPAGPRLGGAQSPWPDAWKAVLADRHGLVVLRLPEDLGRERSVTARGLIAGDAKMIARVVAREKTDQVVIAVATPAGVPPNRTVVTASGVLYDYEGRVVSRFYDSALMPISTRTAETVMRTITQEIVAGLENVWREVNAVTVTPATGAGATATATTTNAGATPEADTGGARILLLHVPAKDIRDWRRQLADLRALPTVDSMQVVQITPEGGVVRLDLSSSVRSLVLAMEASGYEILPGRGDDGRVRLTLARRDG